MKALPVACLIAALAAGIPLSMRGQSALEHAPMLPSSMDRAPSRSGAGTGASSAATPDPESKTDASDDSLYRGKTSDSTNPMLRDEGALHFKTRPNEKIKEVDSLKNLQSTGTDPKFQGSFITSGVSSIDKVGVKANEPAEPAAEPTAAADDKSQGDSRFGRRHMTFVPPEEKKASKNGADSSPSPTPSPSASPAKKKSADAKQ